MKLRGQSEQGSLSVRVLISVLLVIIGGNVNAMNAKPEPHFELRQGKVCKQVEKWSNAGILESRVLKGKPAADSLLPMPDELSQNTILFKDELDINADGKKEYVYIIYYPESASDFQDPENKNMVIEVPYGEEHVELFVFDASLVPVRLSEAGDPAKVLPSDSLTALRIIVYLGDYYLVASRGEALLYVAKLDKSNKIEPLCVFEYQPENGRMANRVLTQYEWLTRSLHESGIPVWEYAFSKDDLSIAEFLVKNGYSVDSLIGKDSPLVWAIDEGRVDIAEWLLRHKVSAKSDALKAALDEKRFSLASKLISYGFDPSTLVFEISEVIGLNDPHVRNLVLAAIKSIKFIPELFVINSINRDLSLLGKFAAMDRPIKPFGVSWHAGERTEIPFYLGQSSFEKSNHKVEEAINKLFRRATVPPEDRFAIASYGSFSDGLEFTRYGLSKMTDEEFLLFTTAFCVSMLPYDCGPESLVKEARKWSTTLTNKCHASMMQKVDEISCRILGYYSEAGKQLVTAFPVLSPIPKEGFTALDGKRILELYRRKKSQ